MKKNLSLRGPHDACAAIPHLLGFIPTESLVLIVERAGKVEVVARVDLTPLSWFELTSKLRPLMGGGRRYLVFSYTSDMLLADDVIARTIAMVGEAQVLGALQVVGDQFRLFKKLDWYRVRAVKSPWLELDDSAVRCSREDVAARIAGPTPHVARVMRRRCGATALKLARENSDLEAVVDDLLAIGLTDAEAVNECVAATLLVCLERDEIRDRVWHRMDRQAAPAYLRVFLTLLAVAPRRYAGSLLGLTALAAWLAGEGVLQVCAIERAFSMNPNDSFLQLAELTAQRCISPQNWRTIL
ncbi:MAG: DUF4192 domain-containing protein [Propionibacteriaceae bacterium]|nr:DUF4192 domain-containing protein [Propionibacteriaceae bacterium]